jgi:hypothetical protein
MGRWGVLRSDTDGQPYPTILYISQGFQNKFRTGCESISGDTQICQRLKKLLYLVNVPAALTNEKQENFDKIHVERTIKHSGVRINRNKV